MVTVVQLTTDNREPFRQYDNATPWFGTAPAALLEGFAGLEAVEVHVVTCAQRPMVSPVKLAANIWFHSLHVPQFGWLRTGYQGCIRAVRRKLRELQPDIVHGQGTERECAVAALLSGFRNVVTLHGNMRLIARVNRARPFSYQWLASRLESFALHRTDGIVCLTDYTRQNVCALARRTWIVPNAVDSRFFSIRPALPSPHPVLLCVGHIESRKNQPALIRSLDPLAAERPLEIRFLGSITSGDPAGVEFKAMLHRRPWCQHLGFASHQTLSKHLAEANLLVLPSLEDNCPMVVLEAMAAGLPVAAARVGGVPDLVQEGVTGTMFDPRDEADIRAKVAGLLREPERVREMGETARRRARQRFLPEVIAREHVEIYLEVLRASS